MAKKQKLKRLSSRFLGPYRHVMYAAYVLLLGSIVVASFRQSILFGVTQSAVYTYFLFRIMRLTGKLQQVSFDDEFLYVFRNDQDLIIPLENIESVEIESLGGVYKVNLYHAEQLGTEFYFKTSLLYPLNAKTKDELVNELRRSIARAKQRTPPLPVNALTS